MAHGTSPLEDGSSSDADAEPARRSTRPGLKPPARPDRPAPAGSEALLWSEMLVPVRVSTPVIGQPRQTATVTATRSDPAEHH
jgi:hypothetical protein